MDRCVHEASNSAPKPLYATKNPFVRAANQLPTATHAVCRISRSEVNFLNGPNRAFESAILR